MVQKYTPYQRQQAKAMYIMEGRSARQISELLNVPVVNIAQWRNLGKWASQRAEIIKELDEKMRADVHRIVNENKTVVMQRHLDIGSKIEQAVEKVVDESLSDDGRPLNPEELELASKAFMQSAKVTGQVVGLSSREHAEGNNMNILIQTGFTPEPVRILTPTPVTVDVQSEEVHEALPASAGEVLEDFPEVEEEDPF